MTYSSIYVIILICHVLGAIPVTVDSAPAAHSVQGQSYQELYPDQWSIGYCVDDCKFDIDTYCSREDNFCVSCHFFCDEDQTLASDVTCQKACPAFFAYQQQQSTNPPTQRTKPVNQNRTTLRSLSRDTTDNPKATANQPQDHINTSPSATVKEYHEERTSATTNPLIFHWLWLLMLIPVTLTVSLMYCYKDTLMKSYHRWWNKLTDHSAAAGGADKDRTQRFGTTYYQLPVVPSAASSMSDQEKTEAPDERSSNEGVESWPYPYNLTAV